MHLNITYSFRFELLLLESIVYLHLKDCVVVPKKRKGNMLSNNEAMGSTRINLFFSFLNDQTAGRV